jgi:hypothetical protein
LLHMNSGLEWKITVRFAMRPKCFSVWDILDTKNRRHSNQIHIGIIRQEPLIYFPVFYVNNSKRIKNI